MAYYVLLYEVGENYLEARTAHRAEHLRLAQSAHERGELVLAGHTASRRRG